MTTAVVGDRTGFRAGTLEVPAPPLLLGSTTATAIAGLSVIAGGWAAKECLMCTSPTTEEDR